MPFEPIRTDEPHKGPRKKERDFDSLMLAGCSSFVAISLLSYVLAVWPHFVFPETYRLKLLVIDSALGLIPAALLGAWATRKLGLPGGGGFIGGALATSIFLHLRLKQVLLIEGEPNLPQPEFPQSWQYLIPAVWMLAVLALVGLLLKREEYSGE